MDLSHRRPPQPAYALSGGRYEPQPPARSGWNEELVNGSATSGLVAALLDAELSGDGFVPARLTIDLLRPAPFAPLVAEVRRMRDGRRLRLGEVELRFADDVVARASGLYLSNGVGDSFDEEVARPGPPEDIAAGKLLPDFDRPMARPPFQHYCDVRWATPCDAREPTVWIRPPEQLVAGMPPSDVARAAAVADLLAGLVATHQTRVDGGYRSAINADQQIVFAGAPRGEWFALRLDRLVARAGSGFACADLFDLDGYRGRVTQSRVSNARRPAVMARD